LFALIFTIIGGVIGKEVEVPVPTNIDYETIAREFLADFQPLVTWVDFLFLAACILLGILMTIHLGRHGVVDFYRERPKLRGKIWLSVGALLLLWIIAVAGITAFAIYYYLEDTIGDRSRWEFGYYVLVEHGLSEKPMNAALLLLFFPIAGPCIFLAVVQLFSPKYLTDLLPLRFLRRPRRTRQEATT
jgi:hypothetical protein